MSITSTKTPIIQKTEELCQTILEQERFQELQVQLQAFSQDGDAQAKYADLVSKQEALRKKQQQGTTLTDEQINEFTQEREALFNQGVVKDYVDAQESLRELYEMINKYITKTIKLGRMPTEADFSPKGCGTGGCGSGCSC